jgi:transcriptional regulator with XRE-family HTH domain
MYKSIADRIAVICKERGITQKHLIQKDLGSTATVSNVFHARQLPTLKFINGFLEMNPDIDARWLITGEFSQQKIEQKNLSVDSNVGYMGSGNQIADIKNGNGSELAVLQERINSMQTQLEMIREQMELKDTIISEKEEQNKLLRELMERR